VADAQAAHEKSMSALLTSLAGANMIYGAGMLELGNTFSFEQFVIDDEIAKMTRKVLEGIDTDDESLAVDVIKNVGPAGNFLLQDHTISHMKTTQSQPNLLDRRVRRDWENDGKKTLTEVASEKAVNILNNYEPEPLPSDVKDELASIIKKAEKYFNA